MKYFKHNWKEIVVAIFMIFTIYELINKRDNNATNLIEIKQQIYAINSDLESIKEDIDSIQNDVTFIHSSIGYIIAMSDF